VMALDRVPLWINRWWNHQTDQDPVPGAGESGWRWWLYCMSPQ